MRSRYLQVLLPVLSIAALAHADQPGYRAKQPVNHKNGIKRVPPEFIQYNNRMMVFTPWHQGYERIENDAFYFGLEGYVTPVVAWPHHHHHHRHRWNALFNAEMRFGYNCFYNGRDHLTPFIGAGYVEQYFRRHHHHHHDHHHNDHHHSRHHRPGVAYGTLGFLYTHEFNTIFNLGFNAKFILGGPVDHKHPKWGSPVVGADVSMPWTFRFGPDRHWDVRLEPFYMVLHGPKETQNYFGGRSNVGYRF